MKTSTYWMRIGTGLLAVLCGCSNSSRTTLTEELRKDPAWPEIQRIAIREVHETEGVLAWSGTADFSPHSHHNGVWHVIAAADYPHNTLGHLIDLQISDDGRVLSYRRRFDERAKDLEGMGGGFAE